jgi:hypothetical protein
MAENERDDTLARRVAGLEQGLAEQTARIDRLAGVIAEQGGRTLAATAGLEGGQAALGGRIDHVVGMAVLLNSNLARLGSIVIADMARRLPGMEPAMALGAELGALARLLDQETGRGETPARDEGEATDG